MIASLPPLTPLEAAGVSQLPAGARRKNEERITRRLQRSLGRTGAPSGPTRQAGCPNIRQPAPGRRTASSRAASAWQSVLVAHLERAVLAVTVRPGVESVPLGGLLYAFGRAARLAPLRLTRGKGSPFNSTSAPLEAAGVGDEADA
jgi:hypothetical protein